MKCHTSLYGTRLALSKNLLLHQMTSRGDEKDAAGVAGLIILGEDKGIKPFAKGSCPCQRKHRTLSIVSALYSNIVTCAITQSHNCM